MSTSFGWEGKGRYGSFCERTHRVCRWNCEITWERVPYLSALEVGSRQGAIQIHVYLYLYLYRFTFMGLFTCMGPFLFCVALLHLWWTFHYHMGRFYFRAVGGSEWTAPALNVTFTINIHFPTFHFIVSLSLIFKKLLDSSLVIFCTKIALSTCTLDVSFDLSSKYSVWCMWLKLFGTILHASE